MAFYSGDAHRDSQFSSIHNMKSRKYQLGEIDGDMQAFSFGRYGPKLFLWIASSSTKSVLFSQSYDTPSSPTCQLSPVG